MALTNFVLMFPWTETNTTINAQDSTDPNLLLPTISLSPTATSVMSSVRLIIAGLLIVILPGCGRDVYESRLATTSEYFEHINTLNENLVPSAVAHRTLAVRVPQQFAPLPDNEETDADETQPYYLNVELLGMLAAYQAGVLVDVDGQDEPRSAFIYVLSNEPITDALANNENEIEPTEFHTEIQNRLSGAFGVYLEPGRTGDGSEPNIPYNEMLPRPAIQGALQYEKSKQYTVIRFRPTNAMAGFDIPMVYDLYMLDQPGDLQYAIFVVAPETARPDENLSSRIRMMLETVTLQQPARGGGGGLPGSGGSPTGGAGLAF